MIESIISEIRNLRYDIRAEALADQIDGLVEQPLFIRTGKANIRPFSKDVWDASHESFANGTAFLQLQLTRIGLYDLLPEGLFFQPPAESGRAKSALEMAEEYRINKKQEEKLRQFFSPLEQAFFHYRCKAYKAETELMSSAEHGLLEDYLLRFWEVPPSVPKAMALRMLLLLPFVHQITGNPKLMAEALSAVLGEQVTCKLIHFWDQESNLQSHVLGAVELGSVSTCGTNFAEEDFVFQFDVILNNPAKIAAYMEGGAALEMIHLFCRYFIPANADEHIHIRLENEQADWVLGAGESSWLGVTSVV